MTKLGVSFTNPFLITRAACRKFLNWLPSPCGVLCVSWLLHHHVFWWLGGLSSGCSFYVMKVFDQETYACWLPGYRRLIFCSRCNDQCNTHDGMSVATCSSCGVFVWGRPPPLPFLISCTNGKRVLYWRRSRPSYSKCPTRSRPRFKPVNWTHEEKRMWSLFLKVGHFLPLSLWFCWWVERNTHHRYEKAGAVLCW